MTPRPLFAALALVALVSFSACDSNDGDDPTPADVAGVYTVSALTFTPDARALPAVNVAAALVAGDTSVELLDGGQAQLRFRRQGGNARFVPGTFEVRRNELRLSFSGGDENQQALDRLLLPRSLTFNRADGGALVFSDNSFTANLQGFDAEQYDGSFRSVAGSLSLRLTPSASL